MKKQNSFVYRIDRLRRRFRRRRAVSAFREKRGFFFGNIILFFETAAGVPRITSPLSKLAFCATSHPALLSRPAACRARALDIRAFRRSYYSKWPL